MSSHSCVAISSRSTLCLVELADRDELRLLVACHNHLGYAFAVIDNEVLL